MTGGNSFLGFLIKAFQEKCGTCMSLTLVRVIRSRSMCIYEPPKMCSPAVIYSLQVSTHHTFLFLVVVVVVMKYAV